MPTFFNFNNRKGVFMIPAGATKSPTPAPPSFSNTKSLSFDGVDEYVSLGDSDDFSFGNGTTDSPFSISAWIKIGQTTAQGIVTKYGSTNATREWLFYTTGAKLRLLFIDASNGANNFATGTTNLSINTWYHVACTYDGRGGSTAYNGINLYINGVAESVTTSGGSYTAMSNTSQVVEIGKYATNELLGNIDEVAIFTSALSPTDISTIATAPSDLSTYNPIAWYRMGDNSTFKSPQILMPENTNKDKVSNYSLSFDGVDDYVATSSLTGLGMGTTDLISVSLWFKTNATKTFPTAFNTGGWPLTSGVNIYLDSTTNNIGARVNNVVITTSGTNYRDDNWHHVLLCYNGSLGSNQIELFVDGVSVGTNTLTGNITSTTTDIHIGANTNTSVGTFRGWEDNVDEVAIFNTDQRANISSIYNSGTPTTISGATAYWKLGEQAKFTDNWLVPNSALSNYSKFSFNFDGVDDYVDIGNPTELQITGNLTLSAWVKRDSTSTSNNYMIIGKDNVNTGIRAYGLVRNTSTGKAQFNIWKSNVLYNVQSTTTINNDQWYHIMGVNDGSDLKIYVNGVLENTNVGGGGTIDNAAIDFEIGRRQAFTNEGYWNGSIDEVAVWNSDQSANISSIYNSGEPTTISGAVAHWRMGEEATYNASTSQWTIPDQIGSNDGTSSNTMALDTLVGEAPNYFGGGVSDAMTIEDRVGDAPNSSNNSVSFNMESTDIDNNTP